jgi:parallel beta-helix repeat protein
MFQMRRHFLSSRLKSYLTLLTFGLFSTGFIFAGVFYTNGIWVRQNGTGNCSAAWSPCAFETAMLMVKPGTVVHFLGTMTTPLVFEKSGAEGQPITFKGGIVDTLGSEEQNAVLVTGSWIVVDNVEIMHGYDFGIRVKGDYVIIQNSKIHDNVTNPLYRQPDGKCNSDNPGGWGSGHRHYIGADHGQMINNEVYNNCGEGITALQANDLRIVGNYVYDNFSVGIYIDSSQDVIIRDNIVRAVDPDFFRNGLPMRGISLGEEEYDWAEFVQIRNIVIDGNQLEGVGDIILLRVSRRTPGVHHHNEQYIPERLRSSNCLA